eukprot:6214801-Pleurochrysis_carterae.AAC.4
MAEGLALHKGGLAGYFIVLGGEGFQLPSKGVHGWEHRGHVDDIAGIVRVGDQNTRLVDVEDGVVGLA